MKSIKLRDAVLIVSIALLLASRATAEERYERFDRDLQWDGHNNRSTAFQCRMTRQDFGYNPDTSRAGGAAGEVGGMIQSAAHPAWYAKSIPACNFDKVLSASGKIRIPEKLSDGHFLVGFFNSRTALGWRTPNSITLRFRGRGEDGRETFFVFADYMTQKWRAGGLAIGGLDPQTGRERPVGFNTGKSVHTWSIHYDPHGAGGKGTLTGTVDDQSITIPLDSGHKADGATFDRFGLLNVMKYAEPPTRVWIDDVTINGKTEDFSVDPRWEGHGNRRGYEDCFVRPRFDFGYSPTNFAGGAASGELGGLVFRGDCRYSNRLACYGDRLNKLTLKRPLKASGKICLRRGITDSTTLIGFYHSLDSMAVNPSQESGTPESFLGAAIEGPSREGFYFYPSYRMLGDQQSHGPGKNPLSILPDGKSHNWTLVYTPEAPGRNGRITVSLDAQSDSIDLPRDDKAADAFFDRFGIVTTWVDGNGQLIYFDDLTYTSKQ